MEIDMYEGRTQREAAKKAARETPIRWRKGALLAPGEWVEGTLEDILRHQPEDGCMSTYWVDFSMVGEGRYYNPPTDARGTFEWTSYDERGREIHTPSLAAGVLVQYLDHVAARARWAAQDLLGLYYLKPEALL